MDLERMSSNIIDIINEVLNCQELVNYIGHDGNFPISTPISPISIAPKGKNERIFAYPFDVEYTDDVRSQLHIYYPSFQFENNGFASKNIVAFDIVVNKKIWLLQDGSKKIIRPYQICKFLIDTLKDKRIGNLGKIHFLKGDHTIINRDFEGIRVVATFTEF